MPSRARPKAAPTKSTVTVSRGQRSLERLHHFQCGACQKWWSIGDAPARPRWYCPWCGVESSFAAPQRAS